MYASVSPKFGHCSLNNWCRTPLNCWKKALIAIALFDLHKILQTECLMPLCIVLRCIKTPLEPCVKIKFLSAVTEHFFFPLCTRAFARFKGAFARGGEIPPLQPTGNNSFTPSLENLIFLLLGEETFLPCYLGLPDCLFFLACLGLLRAHRGLSPLSTGDDNACC